MRSLMDIHSFVIASFVFFFTGRCDVCEKNITLLRGKISFGNLFLREIILGILEIREYFQFYFLQRG